MWITHRISQATSLIEFVLNSRDSIELPGGAYPRTSDVDVVVSMTTKKFNGTNKHTFNGYFCNNTLSTRDLQRKLPKLYPSASIIETVAVMEMSLRKHTVRGWMMICYRTGHRTLVPSRIFNGCYRNDILMKEHVQGTLSLVRVIRIPVCDYWIDSLTICSIGQNIIILRMYSWRES